MKKTITRKRSNVIIYAIFIIFFFFLATCFFTNLNNKQSAETQIAETKDVASPIITLEEEKVIIVRRRKIYTKGCSNR